MDEEVLCVGQPVSLTFTCQSLLSFNTLRAVFFIVLTVLQQEVSGKLCPQNTTAKLRQNLPEFKIQEQGWEKN